MRIPQLKQLYKVVRTCKRCKSQYGTDTAADNLLCPGCYWRKRKAKIIKAGGKHAW